jgi:hypothetical protein
MSRDGDRTAAFLNRFAQSRAVRSPASSSGNGGGYGELPVPANSFFASDVVNSRGSPQQQQQRSHGRRARGGGDAPLHANPNNDHSHVEAQVRSLMEHSNRRNSINTKGRLRYGHVKRSSHFDYHTGYTPDGAGTTAEDHSADYWAMHLELQNATQENERLTAQVAEEMPALRAQIKATEAAAAAAAEAMAAQHAAKLGQMEAALESANQRKTALVASLEESRVEHRETLKNAMLVKATMENKYATLVEKARRQQKRAEDTQTSGERLHALAQTALEQAAIQAQASEYDMGAMRESLRLAQGYQLHTVLMRVQAQAENREKKLTRMVSHLQAEKVALRTNLTEVSQERDQLFHELRKNMGGAGSSLSRSPGAAVAAAVTVQQQRTAAAAAAAATTSRFSSGSSSNTNSSSSFLSGSPSLMALAASADPVSGVGKTSELEEQIKILAVKNSRLSAQLLQEKSNTTTVQKELSPTREMARNMSNQMSAMRETTPKNVLVAAAAAPKSVHSKTRGALLAGLRSGKLAKAVDAMDDAGGPEEALALQNKKKAEATALALRNKPTSARSKTRGALLAGLRNGKLATAVDSMDSAGGPPPPPPSESSAKKSMVLIPVRAGNGDVMAVQMKNMSIQADKAREVPVPIRSGSGQIMAVQLKSSTVKGVTILDEGKFQEGAKVDPVTGWDGDVLAVRVSTRTEKDRAQGESVVSVRDAEGNVMAVRVS